MRSYFAFIFTNIRWLAGGLVLTVSSSFGQTFFISLFSGDIRSELRLSHGDFGAIYMGGTLLSAITLVLIGRVVDNFSVARVAGFVCVALACFCLIMAHVNSALMLFFVIYGLRLTGQGMMTHTAITAMGRWYVAERGRAVSLTSMGHQIGEGLLPITVVFCLAFLGWRQIWWVCAGLMLFVALPLSTQLMKIERIPRSNAQEPGNHGKRWRRRDLIADPLFLLLCFGVMGPGFIGTAFFFHLVHIGEVFNWDRSWIATSFIVLSVTTTTFALVAGILVDRYSACRLLPYFLIPLGLGSLLQSGGGEPYILTLYMLLLGVSYGFSSTIFGSLWAEVYGTRNLGAIRAVAVSVMVLASALGPGVTGWFLDRGVTWSAQLHYMALYCALASVAMWFTSLRLQRRAEDNQSIVDQPS